MRRQNADDGLAAVELAIVLPLFVALLALVAPLAYLFYEDLQLGRTAGDVVRFASSRTDSVRVVDGSPSYTVPAGDLPSVAATAQEAQRAYTGVGAAQLVVPPSTTRLGTEDVGNGCPSGRRVFITLSTDVDLGPFAGLLLGGPEKRTLTARATSCEE